MLYRHIRLRNIATGFAAVLRWTLIALLIGVVCGFAGTGFWYAVNWSDSVLQRFPLLIWFLPLAGLVIVWINLRLHTEKMSTDSVIQAVHDGGKLPLLLAPAVFAGTVLTHFFGGSSGREGAAFQIGGVIGNRIAALLQRWAPGSAEGKTQGIQKATENRAAGNMNLHGTAAAGTQQTAEDNGSFEKCVGNADDMRVSGRSGRSGNTASYEIKVATMAGMAAMFAAIFGLPVTATIFVVLVISVGSFWHSAIYPMMIASFAAYGISGSFGVQKVAFATEIPGSAVDMYVRISILAVLCAFLSTILCDSMHDCAKLLQKRLPNPYVRIALVGAMVSVAVFLTRDTTLSASAAGSLVYSGAGSNLIRLAIEAGTARPWDFIMKLLLTVLTLAAGYKGGEVLPSFAIGAAFGCVIGPLLGIPASFAAAIGLICVFGGASNSVMAPIFLGIEMFGANGIHYYAIAAILSYIMSGYAGFYSSQVIVYSKIAPRRLDLHTNEAHDQREDWRK